MKKYKAVDVLREYCKNVFMNRRATRVFSNVYMGTFEADLAEVSTSGYLTEIELKLTRSDFFADINKADKVRDWSIKHGQPGAYKNIKKYDLLAIGKRVNRFFYLIPKGLVNVNELPVEWAGLIEFTVTDYNGRTYWRFDIVKKAKRLTQDKLGTKWLPKLMESTYWRFHLSRFEKHKR